MAIITHILTKPVREQGDYQIHRVNDYELGPTDVLSIEAGELLGNPLAWKLIAGRIGVNTAAPVANRFMYLTWYGGNLETLNMFISPAVAASAAAALSFGPAGTMGGSSSYGETGGYVNLGDGLPIQGKMKIRCNLENGQTGDVWNVSLLFKHITRSAEEWQRLLRG